MKGELKADALPIERLVPDRLNPRNDADEDLDAALVQSITLHDVQVPLICFHSPPEEIVIADGHRRWRAAKQAGKQVVPVYILPKRPDEAELLTIQLTINAHRSNLNPMDECEAYQRLLELRGWTQAQLAAALAVSAAAVTSSLSLAKLGSSHRQLVRECKITKSAAYALARMPEQEREAFVQRVVAGEVTRDQLNAQARRKPKTAWPTTQRVVCQLPGGSVSVQTSAGLTLTGLIDLLDELIRSCRKARSDGLDILTAVRVLRDRSRNQPTK